MAAHLVVVHPSARTQRIPVTPSTHLSDVLEEACRKFKIDAHAYNLKKDDKPIDLSRTFRLSGLSSGAKLNLILASRSPSVVSVALQLSDKRLTDKFPSNTTIWQLLRRFEEGAAGQNQNGRENITSRGIPKAFSQDSGAGRLYYEQPVIQVMGRTLSSFTDLQKTLNQLGLNSGSILMRLSYQASDAPLEEVVTQHQEYFQSLDSSQPPMAGASSSEVSLPESRIHEPPSELENEARPDRETANENLQPPKSEDATPTVRSTSPGPQVRLPELQNPDDAVMDTSLTATSEQTKPATSTAEPSNATHMETDSSGALPTSSTSSSSRPFEVYTPPASSTPKAARTSYNPADYVPTIEHAQRHQKHLEESSRPRRLPTDAEIEAREEAAAQQLERIKDVRISVRFPSQDRLEASFGQTDTGQSLYSFVREHLEQHLAKELFILGYTGDKGRQTNVPDTATKRLIKDLGLRNRVLVTFTWDDEKASLEARGTKEVLKEESRSKAKSLQVQEVQGAMDNGDAGMKVDVGKKENAEGGEKKKSMPKWLQKLSKK